MTSSIRIRKGFLATALAALACTLLLAVPATSSALPGKRVAIKTTTEQAFLADSAIWTTSAWGCFDTFRSGYPCRRILRPRNLWIVGYYPPPIGWEFGSGDSTASGYSGGWKILCGKGSRVAERNQTNRDGLAPDYYWIGQKIIKLPIPMKNPAWCEVDVEVGSPTYSETWNTEEVVTSEVQIRATSRRR
ncbi:MAG: hypothetical protein ACKOB2_06580 [Solirubrobacterales bacterium]